VTLPTVTRYGISLTSLIRVLTGMDSAGIAYGVPGTQLSPELSRQSKGQAQNLGGLRGCSVQECGQSMHLS
jgi:hypothetical protein